MVSAATEGCHVGHSQEFVGTVYRREPLYEAHDSTFGILENYHCWRFHGSGVIAALQIKDLIFFCTFLYMSIFEVVNVLSCSPFMFENTENIQLFDG